MRDAMPAQPQTRNQENMSTLTKALLTLKGSLPSFSLTPQAPRQKADMLKASHAITVIESPEQAELARTTVLKDLAAFRVQMDKDRKAVKQPFIDKGREIDQIASETLKEVIAEENRLKELIARQAERQAAEERRIEAERRRIEAERLQKEQEALEAARKAEQAKTSLSQLRAEAQADKAREEAEELERQREQAKLALVENRTLSGTKMVDDFDVVDPHELYRHDPSLVTITVSRQAVLNRLQVMRMQHGPDAALTLPGLACKRVAKISSR